MFKFRDTIPLAFKYLTASEDETWGKLLWWVQAEDAGHKLGMALYTQNNICLIWVISNLGTGNIHLIEFTFYQENTHWNNF